MKKQTSNSTFEIDGVSCFAGNFVVTATEVFRMNLCTEKPAHRKSAKCSKQLAAYRLLLATIQTTLYTTPQSSQSASPEFYILQNPSL